MMKKILTTLLLTISLVGFAQEDTTENEKSNIQTYTPSKLLSSGQWDIKWFNNLYTETKDLFGPNGSKQDIPRNTFFTSTLDVFTGISANSKLNVGLLLEFRSNVVGGRDALDVFKFDGETNSARSGLTSFAPAIKFNPIKGVGNFTIQTAFHIPLIDNETENGVFLDQKGFIFQNRFFYDYSFSGDKWQLFSELNTEYNFGKKEDSFANNSLRLTPGVFLSYFPSSKFTVLGLIQHSQLIDAGNDFSQDFTALGGGLKYQLTDVLNVETLYTGFVRGNDTGLGQSFNIGLRALF
ncbi:hypothetical protein [Algibacter lectus]|uniref:Transporter n=1 Tax=Algibacter lectus TaxID=221126 RepID=A0A090WZM9_9FLAO|nr:hypothetical protein [Algibacter lectus]GAL63353.1 hypothetical protein JCM19300_1699 [Algibacter lectus]GAL80879.1 hypothetical protein JCM19274_1505 [Algibacter lectus]